MYYYDVHGVEIIPEVALSELALAENSRSGETMTYTVNALVLLKSCPDRWCAALEESDDEAGKPPD